MNADAFAQGAAAKTTTTTNASASAPSPSDKQQQQGAVYNTRLVLLGAAGVGKSALVNTIVHATLVKGAPVKGVVKDDDLVEESCVLCPVLCTGGTAESNDADTAINAFLFGEEAATGAGGWNARWCEEDEKLSFLTHPQAALHMQCTSAVATAAPPTTTASSTSTTTATMIHNNNNNNNNNNEQNLVAVEDTPPYAPVGTPLPVGTLPPTTALPVSVRGSKNEGKQPTLFLEGRCSLRYRDRADVCALLSECYDYVLSAVPNSARSLTADRLRQQRHQQNNKDNHHLAKDREEDACRCLGQPPGFVFELHAKLRDDRILESEALAQLLLPARFLPLLGTVREYRVRCPRHDEDATSAKATGKRGVGAVDEEAGYNTTRARAILAKLHTYLLRNATGPWSHWGLLDASSAVDMVVPSNLPVTAIVDTPGLQSAHGTSFMANNARSRWALVQALRDGGASHAIWMPDVGHHINSTPTATGTCDADYIAAVPSWPLGTGAASAMAVAVAALLDSGAFDMFDDAGVWQSWLAPQSSDDAKAAPSSSPESAKKDPVPCSGAFLWVRNHFLTSQRTVSRRRAVDRTFLTMQRRHLASSMLDSPLGRDGFSAVLPPCFVVDCGTPADIEEFMDYLRHLTRRDVTATSPGQISTSAQGVVEVLKTRSRAMMAGRAILSACNSLVNSYFGGGAAGSSAAAAPSVNAARSEDPAMLDDGTDHDGDHDEADPIVNDDVVMDAVNEQQYQVVPYCFADVNQAMEEGEEQVTEDTRVDGDDDSAAAALRSLATSDLPMCTAHLHLDDDSPPPPPPPSEEEEEEEEEPCDHYAIEAGGAYSFDGTASASTYSRRRGVATPGFTARLWGSAVNNGGGNPDENRDDANPPSAHGAGNALANALAILSRDVPVPPLDSPPTMTLTARKRRAMQLREDGEGEEVCSPPPTRPKRRRGRAVVADANVGAGAVDESNDVVVAAADECTPPPPPAPPSRPTSSKTRKRRRATSVDADTAVDEDDNDDAAMVAMADECSPTTPPVMQHKPTSARRKSRRAVGACANDEAIGNDDDAAPQAGADAWQATVAPSTSVGARSEPARRTRRRTGGGAAWHGKNGKGGWWT